MKIKNVENMQAMCVAKLKIVGHMYINMIFSLHKIWATMTVGQFTLMANFKGFTLYMF
jgi:hypothetical protein